MVHPQQYLISLHVVGPSLGIRSFLCVPVALTGNARSELKYAAGRSGGSLSLSTRETQGLEVPLAC